MTLCELCKQIPALKGACKPGLQAMKRGDRQYIKCGNPRDLTGSIDLDSHLKRDYPSEPRWDYCIGYGDCAYFIEVHPAGRVGTVEEVIRKKEWTEKWLEQHASEILARQASQRAWVWIASGKIAIGRRNRYSIQLARKGIHGPKRQYKLP